MILFNTALLLASIIIVFRMPNKEYALQGIALVIFSLFLLILTLRNGL